VYWRFSGYPTVAAQGALRDGAAARAGIRDGDVLISVNGHTPMSDEGARLLSQSERELTLTLEFSRGGTRSTYRLRL
jgi:S1-C subfamily serine protease